MPHSLQWIFHVAGGSLRGWVLAWLQLERWLRQAVWVEVRWCTGRARRGGEGHQRAVVVFNSFLLSLPTPPFLPRPIIALECTHLTPVKSQTKWKQQQYEMGIWKYLVVRECVDNLILGCQRTAAGILQESHFDKVEALA